jgi:hypothetical protein
MIIVVIKVVEDLENSPHFSVTRNTWDSSDALPSNQMKNWVFTNISLSQA